ncbi:hypothetical protein [Zwartia sp.]|uniref:AtuA-related protein n=1 Tax=Zwartia sp. TaxID=2978004 RepID=UPI002723ADCB|nr:hypothetical protein [Zwartia sp.]MDO9023637.1 hypothetical protein [Zwartia sp.]
MNATTSQLNAQPTVQLPLYQLAHGRAGDKGNTSNISVIAWDEACFELLVAQATESRVAQWFGYRHPTQVTRYVLPKLQAMNFVLEGILDGGVNDALNLDTHGKGLSFWMMDMPIEVPKTLAERLGIKEYSQAI